MSVATAQTPTPAGTQIENTATAQFGGITLPSNPVVFDIDLGPTPATLSIMRVAVGGAPADPVDVSDTQCADATGTFGAAPPPSGFDPFNPADPTNLDAAPATDTDVISVGQPFLVELEDQNRNADPAARETVEVTVTARELGPAGPGPVVDTETVLLTETGPNTGVFAGYLQSANGESAAPVDFDCQLSVTPNSRIDANYVDPVYPEDTAADDVLVDPFGIVFDSRTGEPVDGAIVTLFLADANGNPIPLDQQPPRIFGDPQNGNPPVEGFPNNLVTGDALTFDGVVYNVPDGGFRFPLVPPGDYVLLVETPDGFTFTSSVSVSELDSRFGDIYQIDDPGSFGGSFPVPLGPAVNIDIPIDPDPLVIALEKIASRTEAGIGDFIQYRLTLENLSDEIIESTEVVDILPSGFRYQEGSLRQDQAPAAFDILVSEDGRTLTIPVGAIGPGFRAVYTYVTQITAGASQGRQVNTAEANGELPTTVGPFPVASNTASAAVRVTNDFFTDNMTIIGRVIEGQCNTPAEELVGVENIRLLLEDGTYVTTDRDGHYHFRGVRPGTHVVQVDIDTVPLHMEMIPCIRNSRHGGRTHSRFVDGRGGTLWREDFYLRALPPLEQVQAPVGIRLQTIGRPLPELFSFVGNFGVLKADLTAQDIAELENIARQVEGRVVDRIEVSGHTSSVRVAPEHRHIFANNYELSEARAAAAATWLAQRLNLPADRFVIEGFGPSTPVASNATAEGRALNRRVEVRVRASTPMRYRATMDAGSINAGKSRIMVMAPDGVVLDPTSATLDGAPLPGARVSGSVATFPLGETGSNWQHVVEINGQAPINFTTTEVFRAQFDTRKATLKPQGEREIAALIDKLKGQNVTHVHAIGHTDSIRIAPEHRNEFANNKVLSEARARTVANRLAAELGLKPDQVSVSGMGPTRPLAENDTAEGRALNRRVELRITQGGGSLQCENNATLTAKAVGIFDTELSANQRTEVVENEHRCQAAQMTTRRFDFTPHFDTMKAEIRFEDRAGLDAIAAELAQERVETLTTTGHTDARVIDGNAQKIYEDNKALSLARSKAVSDYVGNQIGLADYQKRVLGEAATQPVAPNTTPEQLAKNRRVDIEARATDSRSSRGLQITVPDSGRKQSTVLANQDDLRPHMVSQTLINKPRAYALPEEQEKMVERDFTQGAPATNGFVYPAADSNPRIPATFVAVKHNINQTVRLKVNGIEVHPLNYNGLQKSADRKTAISVWRAVKLDTGPNTLTADVMDASGAVVDTFERQTHYAATPTRVEFLPEESVLVADGINTAVLAFRFYDRYNMPVRPYATGNFGIRPPYQSQQEIDWQNSRAIAGIENFAPTYRVEKDGVAYIEVAPTTESGNVVVDFTLADQRVDEKRVWLEAGARDWILVGFAEGTVGYNTLKGNTQPLREQGADEDLYTDGEAAFYAKGRVSGKWLLTAAYDTRRARETDISGRLNGTIDPDESYILYGDAALQRHDAASVEKLYVRIERPRFYALFGDYNTGLSVTELSRYNRTLTGFKSEYAGRNLSYNLFAAETEHGFVRDEIAANGTSGPYRLSRPDLLINSEQVFIERRDRFTAIPFADREVLRRHIDYDIDYVNGTLFFRTPQLSRDNEFNPRFIIVEYEVNALDDEALNAGGRGELKFGGLGGDMVRIGVSAIHDDTGSTETDLYGLDARVRFNNRTELFLEAATSDTTGDVDNDGNAYLARLEHRGEVALGQIYYAEQDEGFGVGQQALSSSGTRKYGVDMLFKITDRLGVRTAADHLESKTEDAERDVAAVELRYQTPGAGVTVGVQHARDQREGETQESTQAVLGVNKDFFSGRMRAEARAESSLSGSASENDQSVDYPKRYLVGLTYRLTEATDVFVQHEITDGSTFDGSITRAGMRTRPWANALLTTSVDQTMSEAGPRTFGVMGLRQNLLLDENWTADISLDRSQTIREPGQPEPLIPNQTVSSAPPSATGVASDFTAVSTGLTYLSEHWSWNARIEGRQADTDDRYGLTTAFLRQVEAGKAFSSQLQIFDIRSNIADARSTIADMQLSWAWRPLTQNWSILDRLDLEYDRTQSAGNEIRTAKIVNNLNVNWVSGIGDDFEDDRGWDYMNDRVQTWQWSLYYGTKYVVNTFDGEEYDSFGHLLGVEARFDVTSWLDLGYHYSLLHTVPLNGNFFDSFSEGQLAYSMGPRIGVSPMNNLWLTLGYNLSGFEDDDFESGNYYEHGPYLKLRFKFDQLTGLKRDGRHHKLAPWDEDQADREYWEQGRNVQPVPGPRRDDLTGVGP